MNKTPAIILAILGLALAIRVPFINTPALSMRQADNAGIARNYYEGGMHFLRPQIDWSGSGTGVAQTEFPVYQYTLALSYKVLGVNDMWGRALAIIFSLAAIFAMFVLVRDFMGQVAGLWSAFALAVFPIFAELSQDIMVESAMLFACVLAVLSLHRWLAGRGTRWYWLFAAAASVAGLLKIISLVHLFFPVVFLLWITHRWKAAKMPSIWAALALILLPVLAWYAWSGVLLRETGNSVFGDWRYGTDKWGNWALLASGKFWNRVVVQGVFEKNLTWFGFVPFAIGLFAPRHSREERVFDWWLAGCLVYSAVVTQGNFVHRYYQVPYVLAASAVVARGFMFLSARSKYLAMVFAAALALAGSWGAWREMDPGRTREMVPLAELVREKAAPGDRLIAFDRNNPRLLYLSRHKGWVADDDGFASGVVERARVAGARWLAGRYPAPDRPGEVQALRKQMRGWRVIYDNGRVFLAVAKGR